MFKLWTAEEAASRGKELSQEALNQYTALEQFFMKMYPGVGVPADIYFYFGSAEGVEVRFIRFEMDGKSYTFVVQESLYEFFITDWLKGPDNHDWCDRPNQCAVMVDKGWKRNVTKTPIEFPRHLFPAYTQDTYGWEHLENGDFIQADEVMERFRFAFHEKIGYVTRLAEKLDILVTNKDHDLYLSFKGVDFFKRINVGLDRVYPKLPESGQISLGDSPIDPEDWDMFNKIIQVNVKRISHATGQINRMIEKHRAMISQDPHIQHCFDGFLKTQLMAASHFMKRIYGFSAEHGVEIMESVANDVIRRLTSHGGNIGLDLNEWVVYEYHGEGIEPTKVEDPELDFKNGLFNRYTVSFIDALYAYLLDTPNPYIKPYDYRKTVTEDDGIAVGTIRHVK